MDNVWLEISARLRERLGKQNFESWIKPVRFVSRQKNEFVLHVPNQLYYEWIKEHFSESIE